MPPPLPCNDPISCNGLEKWKVYSYLLFMTYPPEFSSSSILFNFLKVKVRLLIFFTKYRTRFSHLRFLSTIIPKYFASTVDLTSLLFVPNSTVIGSLQYIFLLKQEASNIYDANKSKVSKLFLLG